MTKTAETAAPKSKPAQNVVKNSPYNMLANAGVGALKLLANAEDHKHVQVRDAKIL